MWRGFRGQDPKPIRWGAGYSFSRQWVPCGSSWIQACRKVYTSTLHHLIGISSLASTHIVLASRPVAALGEIGPTPGSNRLVEKYHQKCRRGRSSRGARVHAARRPLANSPDLDNSELAPHRALVELFASHACEPDQQRKARRHRVLERGLLHRCPPRETVSARDNLFPSANQLRQCLKPPARDSGDRDPRSFADRRWRPRSQLSLQAVEIPSAVLSD